MELYQLVSYIAFFIISQSEAGVCNPKNTVIQVRVPQRTNVTVKYPPKLQSPVQYVPYPYLLGNNRGQCYKCQNFRCYKCNSNPNITPPLPTGSRTNIIIDVQGSRSRPEFPSNQGYRVPDSNKQGTLVVIQGSSAASSTADGSARGNGDNSAASVSSSASDNQLIADFKEDDIAPDGSRKKTEDIFVSDNSQSNSSAAAASSSNGPGEGNANAQAKTSVNGSPSSSALANSADSGAPINSPLNRDDAIESSSEDSLPPNVEYEWVPDKDQIGEDDPNQQPNINDGQENDNSAGDVIISNGENSATNNNNSPGNGNSPDNGNIPPNSEDVPNDSNIPNNVNIPNNEAPNNNDVSKPEASEAQEQNLMVSNGNTPDKEAGPPINNEDPPPIAEEENKEEKEDNLEGPPDATKGVEEKI